MNVASIVFAFFKTHLPDSLQEWKRLNISNGSSYLYNGNVISLSSFTDMQLNFIGYMRYDLNCLPKIFPTSFFFNHTIVNLSRGEIVTLRHFGGDKPFVMAKIKIGFGTIIRDKHLAMLKRAHSSWVDVDIGI